MLTVSLWTSIFGLTEPLFVPAYWNPPSLFNLAQNTGFDLESFIFSFGIGGLVVVLYEKFFPAEHVFLSQREKNMPRHRYHKLAVATGPAVFLSLLAFSGLNPIYIVFISLMSGGAVLLYCRPDLGQKMVVSAFIFTIFYFIYFFTLLAMFPGYVEAVWNLAGISGILVLGVPLEELMFAFGFGFAWSSVYEHFRWYKILTTKS